MDGATPAHARCASVLNHLAPDDEDLAGAIRAATAADEARRCNLTTVEEAFPLAVIA